MISTGNPQGDEFLRRITWRIHNTLDEEYEYLIRYGGEEFLYIGIGIDESTAEGKTQYFNKIIRELVIGPSDREPMGITISIGSYTVNWDETTEHPIGKTALVKPTKQCIWQRTAEKINASALRESIKKLKNC